MSQLRTNIVRIRKPGLVVDPSYLVLLRTIDVSQYGWTHLPVGEPPIPPDPPDRTKDTLMLVANKARHLSGHEYVVTRRDYPPSSAITPWDFLEVGYDPKTNALDLQPGSHLPTDVSYTVPSPELSDLPFSESPLIVTFFQKEYKLRPFAQPTLSVGSFTYVVDTSKVRIPLFQNIWFSADYKVDSGWQYKPVRRVLIIEKTLHIDGRTAFGVFGYVHLPATALSIKPLVWPPTSASVGVSACIKIISDKVRSKHFIGDAIAIDLSDFYFPPI